MKKQLLAVKLIHSIIWLILATTTFYILYSGLFNRITVYTWIAIATIVGEGIILLIFKWKCPLTVVARRYSDSQKDNFDIFLPEWLARQNKTIFTIIFLTGVLLVVYRKLHS